MLPSGWSIITNIESTAIRFGSDILSKQDKCSLVSAHDRIIALFHNDIMNTVLCLIWIKWKWYPGQWCPGSDVRNERNCQSCSSSAVHLRLDPKPQVSILQANSKCRLVDLTDKRKPTMHVANVLQKWLTARPTSITSYTLTVFQDISNQ